MRNPFLLVLLFCISLSQLHAQSELPAMGFYSEEERNLSVCAFDKDAEAVVLLDHAVSDHDEDYNLITTRRIRIKILTDKEINGEIIRILFTQKINLNSFIKLKALLITGIPLPANLKLLNLTRTRFLPKRSMIIFR